MIISKNRKEIEMSKLEGFEVVGAESERTRSTDSVSTVEYACPSPQKTVRNIPCRDRPSAFLWPPKGWS